MTNAYVKQLARRVQAAINGELSGWAAAYERLLSAAGITQDEIEKACVPSNVLVDVLKKLVVQLPARERSKYPFFVLEYLA